MTNSVPAANIGGMIFSLLIAIGLPIALCIIVKVKMKAKMSSVFIGAATFIVFALILEQILHVIVLRNTGIAKNIWLYALYGGLAAGLFEETGRYLAMKFVMKKNLDKQNALMYGVGHGGIESILVVGLAQFSNIATALMINSGQAESLFAAFDEATMANIAQLWQLPAYQFYISGIERIAAIFLHIGLSYLVYRAVKEQKMKFFFLALALHVLIDAVVVAASSFLPIVLIEAILLVAVAVLIYYVCRMYGKEA